MPTLLERTRRTRRFMATARSVRMARRRETAKAPIPSQNLLRPDLRRRMATGLSFMRMRLRHPMHRAVEAWMQDTRVSLQEGLRRLEKQTPEQLTTQLTDWKWIEEDGKKRLEPTRLTIMQKYGEEQQRLSGLEGSFNVYDPRVGRWAEQHGAKLVADITASTKDAVAKGIRRGLDKGLGIREIAADMRDTVGLTDRLAVAAEKFKTKVFERYPAERAQKMYDRKVAKYHKYRTQMIARTETAAACSEVDLRSYRNVGLKKVEFMANPGACPLCTDLNGTTYPLGKGKGVIPVHPHCVCAWLPVIEEGWQPTMPEPIAPVGRPPTAPRLPRRPRPTPRRPAPSAPAPPTPAPSDPIMQNLGPGRKAEPLRREGMLRYDKWDDVDNPGFGKTFKNREEALEYGRKHTATWAEEMSHAEQRSFSHYAGSAEVEHVDSIQMLMRDGKKDFMANMRQISSEPGRLLREAQEHADNLMKQIGKAPRLKDDLTLFRLTDPPGFDPFVKHVGAELVDKGFLSTSLAKDNAFTMHKGIRLEIRVKKGTRLAYIEHNDFMAPYMAEHVGEVVLPPGKLRVIGDTVRNGRRTLICTFEPLPIGVKVPKLPRIPRVPKPPKLPPKPAAGTPSFTGRYPKTLDGLRDEIGAINREIQRLEGSGFKVSVRNERLLRRRAGLWQREHKLKKPPVVKPKPLPKPKPPVPEPSEIVDWQGDRVDFIKYNRTKGSADLAVSPQTAETYAGDPARLRRFKEWKASISEREFNSVSMWGTGDIVGDFRAIEAGTASWGQTPVDNVMRRFMNVLDRAPQEWRGTAYRGLRLTEKQLKNLIPNSTMNLRSTSSFAGEGVGQLKGHFGRRTAMQYAFESPITGGVGEGVPCLMEGKLKHGIDLGNLWGGGTKLDPMMTGEPTEILMRRGQRLKIKSVRKARVRWQGKMREVRIIRFEEV